MTKNPFKALGQKAKAFKEEHFPKKDAAAPVALGSEGAPKKTPKSKKEPTPKKDTATLLCEVMPSLVKVPRDYLGSTTMVGAAFSVFGSAFGNIFKLSGIEDKVEKGLREELHTKASLVKMLDNTDLKNRALQSDFIKALVANEEIWQTLQQPKQIKNLLKALDPKCYEKLDAEVKDVIESPSTITTESKIHLATVISQNPVALSAIKSILRGGSTKLTQYLASSPVIEEQLSAVGIKSPENQRLLFSLGIPFAQDAVANLDEIMNVVQIALAQQPDSIDIAAIAEAAGDLVPMLRSESVSAFLDPDIMQPIVAELITNYDKEIRTAIDIKDPDIQLSSLMNSFAAAAMNMAKTTISDSKKVQFITDMAKEVGAYNDTKEGTPERAAATTKIINYFIENFETAGFTEMYDEQLVPILRENKAAIAKIIEAKAAAAPVLLKVNGERIVDIISNSKNIMGLIKLAHQFSTATIWGKFKLATTLPRLMWDNFEAVKEVASIAVSIIKPYIQAKISRKKKTKEEVAVSAPAAEEKVAAQDASVVDISALRTATDITPPSKSPAAKVSFTQRLRGKFSQNKGKSGTSQR